MRRCGGLPQGQPASSVAERRRGSGLRAPGLFPSIVDRGHNGAGGRAHLRQQKRPLILTRPVTVMNGEGESGWSGPGREASAAEIAFMAFESGAEMLGVREILHCHKRPPCDFAVVKRWRYNQ